MRDDTLDALLLALLASPHDAAQIAIIGDWLEDHDHPAATWWRDRARAPLYRIPAGEHMCGVPMWSFADQWYLISKVQYAAESGATDICARLDRLAAATVEGADGPFGRTHP